ncbi:hypothetical protein DFH06DRAFT_1148652 [Mycena polygramma]|nr:hypothetical protein DFH06DRAFT_1148652 [Mycena polygramma]
MTEMIVDSDDDHIASALAAWADFDDETRPDALRSLAHALVLRQERIVQERHAEFARICKKTRNHSSLRSYKKREDARRALARSRLLPPGVPEDCPVRLVDGVIEVLPYVDEEEDDEKENDSTPTPPPLIPRIPRTLSDIAQDESEGDASDADSTSAVQSHHDAAAAADALDALAGLPSPLLLPSPDLPSPTYNAHSSQCRYGPARLEGQTDGEGVETHWGPLRNADEETEFQRDFRAGFSRGLYRAWELALAPPSSPEPGHDQTPDDEWAHLTSLLKPSTTKSSTRDAASTSEASTSEASTSAAASSSLPSSAEVASGDLTLAEIEEVENAWVRVLRALHREVEEDNEVAAVLLAGEDSDSSMSDFD